MTMNSELKQMLYEPTQPSSGFLINQVGQSPFKYAGNDIKLHGHLCQQEIQTW